ncbi:MAG: signal peptidase I [Clostridia bacterium]|nr:signal peptidase I [Clostridia bacterium]
MKKGNLGKIKDVVSGIIVAIVFIVAVALVGARIVGYGVYTVVSGSMEPTYSVGDLIYVKKVDPAEIKVGDPITFVLNDDLVVATHRVVEIDSPNQHFYTKGDANESPDASPVHFNNLIGKPVFKVPFVGYISNWIKTPPGIYIAFGGCALLLAVVFLPDLFTGKQNNSKKQNEDSESET